MICIAISKVCSSCRKDLDLAYFSRKSKSRDGKAGICKNCAKARTAAWRVQNSDRAKEACKRWRKNNPERHRELNRNSASTRRIADPELMRAKERSRYLKNRSAYRKRKNKYERAKRATDFSFKIAANLRRRLRQALSRQFANKTYRTLDLLGCTAPELQQHLAAQFRPGMTIENHGKVWHIDHIRPCASFDLADPEQVRQCFHYTNLQPLFVAENLAKGAKYEFGVNLSAEKAEESACRN